METTFLSKRATCLPALFLLGLLVIGAGNAHADLYDLSGSSTATVTVNGAWFYNTDAASTGTGFIDSFVRLKEVKEGGLPVEEGYNTDGRKTFYTENSSPQFTRSLRLSVIPIVGIEGRAGSYREFLLDINQDGSSPLLSLDEIKIYQWADPDFKSDIAGLGTPVYDLDRGVASPDDNWIVLSYAFDHGSGSGDMFAYIPNDLFLVDPARPYVYLYSKFGVHNANNDGFEEWAMREGVLPPVPVPGAVILAGIGLSFAGGWLRRRATL